MSYLIHSGGSQAQGSHFFVPKTMNADYWEKRTALIRDGAVRVLSLFRPEEVDYWRDELKSNRRNTREIELMTWAKHAATLRGRAHYGPMDQVAEYVFVFNAFEIRSCRVFEGRPQGAGAAGDRYIRD